MSQMPEQGRSFVSRAGLKLDHALNEFDLDVAGLICADFGCNVGGFTDCLLKRGAKLVYAIDTGYGVLDYALRTDDRVIVMERTNALHAQPPDTADARKKVSGTFSSEMVPDTFFGVDLVAIDLGWTPQRLAIPAALRWLRPFHSPTSPTTPTPSGDGVTSGGGTPPCIITLIKPHYELSESEKRSLLVEGRLDPAHAEEVVQRVLEAMGELGVVVQAWTRSPITGGKSARKSRGAGNVEYLALLAPAETANAP